MHNNLKFLAALYFAVFCTLSLVANAGEKFEQTYVKGNFRTVARSAIPLSDPPNHEIGQELTLAEIKYSHSSFKTKEEWAFNQFNFVGGSGPHWGTYVDVHEDGSQTFGRYEGSQKTISNADGSWTATWEGTYKYTGGTGKYKNIKGGGTYKGKATSAGDTREEGKETVEY